MATTETFSDFIISCLQFHGKSNFFLIKQILKKHKISFVSRHHDYKNLIPCLTLYKQLIFLKTYYFSYAFHS